MNNTKPIPEEIKCILQKRKDNSHKGTYGKVGIIAGSKGMTGSAFLASNASLKSGSGLVYNIVDSDIFDIMSIKYVEVIAKCFENNEKLRIFLNTLDSICIGPGIGTDNKNELLRMTVEVNKPLLIDADGLNILSKDINLLNKRSAPTVLTPHLKEFSRLTNFDINYISNNKLSCVEEFVNNYDVVLVLKGHETIVASKNEIYINKTGNAGMATAGSGDVLSGIITSFLGRNISAFDSAKIGTFIHGLAGDFAAEKYSMESMIASDIINSLADVFKIKELYKW